MSAAATVQSAVPKWDELSPFVKDVLHAIAKRENFINYDLRIESGSNVGDGFMSVMMKVTVDGWKKDEPIVNKGQRQTLRLVCKIPPLSKARRDTFSSMQLFEREAIIYNEYLPLLEQYQLEQGIVAEEGFFNHPKCYHAEYNAELDEAILVLEDLGAAGYTMWNKFEPMNYKHCKKVVEAIGRYHALSLVLKKQRPELFADFAALHDVLMDLFTKPETQDMWNQYFDQAINSFSADESKYVEIIKRYKADLVSEFTRIVDGAAAEPYTVLAHGDCWINNFMFRRNGEFPTAITFIDFQIARYVSPVLDLMYFIFVSTDKKLRDVHYDDLLRSYHNSLSNLVERCGEDPTILFPYEAFQQHLREYGSFGLPMALMLLPVITIPGNEVPDMDHVGEMMKELQETGVKSQEYLDMEQRMHESGKKVAGRIHDVIVDIANLGYIK